MTNINPINFGISSNPYFKKDAKEDLKGTENRQAASDAKSKNLESGEVLGYMAAQNADLIPTNTTKTVNVSKYVTPEQEARIAAFIQGFEADFEEVSAAAAAEFGGMSQEAADTVALAYINSTY